MSFARHNRGRSLYGHTDIASVREKELLSQNQLLREKNKRLSDAILTLVDHIENKLPQLESPTAFKTSEVPKNGYSQPENIFQESEPKPRVPDVEIFESYPEPIEFAEPAPQMHFGKSAKCNSRSQSAEWAQQAPEYSVSPDLEPEEIDLLKSPIRTWPKEAKQVRETVDIVDLEPKINEGNEPEEVYEAATVTSSDIPNFDFEEEGPVVDIEVERRETLRAAMRRRVNRLRW